MAMKACVECKREISTDATTCPHCGKNAPTGISAKRILLGVLVVLMGFVGFAVLTGGGQSAPGRSVIPSIQSGVTLAGYESLKTGMSYEEAVRALGQNGEELSRSELAGFTTVMYQWRGSGGIGANMNAMFQNGGLVNKAQVGLR